jgi:hypothetical protein
MSEEPTDTRTVMRPLESLIGEWSMELAIPGAAPVGSGSAVFEWILGGRFVVQRTSSPDPNAPDGFMVISADQPAGYTQHYFDDRGVVRVYEMTFADGEWTLLRERPDFSPLDFSQRFVGTFSKDGHTIEGRWEQRSDDGDWRLDFGLTYRRM